MNDHCQGGSCQGGGQKSCTYLNGSCVKGACQGGSCVKVAKSGSCSDGDGCTVNDYCSGGVCKSGSPKSCSYLNTSCRTGYCKYGSCKTQSKSGSCSDGNACTVNDYCSGGSCKSGSKKSCAQYATECRTAYCSNSTGGCKTSNKPKGTSCSKGACDGYGACKSTCGYRPTDYVDGCTGSSYKSSCSKYCDGCTTQNGFTAHNSAGCSGYTCFQRFPYHGKSGFLAMFRRSSQTAYVRWDFDKTLCGKYRIYAYLPDPVALKLNPKPCSSWKFVTDARYNLKKGNTTVSTKTVNHASYKGGYVQIFAGSLDGATGVTLGNTSSVSGCTVFLVDELKAVPY